MSKLVEVLIVEDDPRIAEINRRFTEKIEGFKVIATATTGEEAKEWLEVVQPNLVLLDVYLPDMKGIELIKYIRKNFYEIDVIMITAASEVDVVRHALRGGVVDYIVKPLTFERFKESLVNYKNKIEKLQKNEKLSPELIESLWNRQSNGKTVENQSPKGIDPLTLDKILKYIDTIGESGITAEVLSKNTGISRSTARRYLEYLVSQRKIYAELVYGNVGRPERRYFLTLP
ncbi:response regulator [Calidifontibacillus erzurumensis]|uniref:Response regulator n=1 Tax=Calidifontibacillus erzurumensis TaxID=2741433 RepID=A0A8J8KF39_9BACI|nr:response regulator [Calidifontibacillus erzurumensis]NSL52495.1 response regulator [Calidifontibacillus erzurumensis]